MRRSPRWCGRAVPARPYRRAALCRRRPRRRRGRAHRPSTGEGAGQCDAAPLPARARRAERAGRGRRARSRAGRIRAGGSAASRPTIRSIGNRFSPSATSVRRSRCASIAASARGTRFWRSSPRRASRARRGGTEGIIVDPPRPVTALPGFAEGAFAVQDLGAQLAAPLLASRDGMRVLDACAAPGRQDHAPPRTGRHRTDGARPRRRAAARAFARISRACGMTGAMSTSSAGDAGDAVRVVGRPPVRPDPCRTCRARRRASCAAIRTGNGCAARPTSRHWPANSSGSSRRCGRCWRPAGSCFMRPARCLPAENERRIDEFLARNARSVARNHQFRTRNRP